MPLGVIVIAPRSGIVPVNGPLALEAVFPANKSAAAALPVARMIDAIFGISCAHVSLVDAVTPKATSAATTSALRSLPA
ncbi:hypothetical protein D3C73_1302000 [compost metagenome]